MDIELRGLINMHEDPYAEMLRLMEEHGRKDNPPSIKVAKVVYVEETSSKILDIKIEVDDLTIDKDNIYISDYLLKEHKREVRTDGMTNIPSKQFVSGATSSVNDGGNNAQNHSHAITSLTINHTNIYTRDSLKKDDLVSVMALEGKQSYIILSRVVRIDE